MKVSLCAPSYFSVDDRGSDFAFQLGKALGRKGMEVVLYTFTRGLESHLSVLSKAVLNLEGVRVKKFEPRVLRIVGMQPQLYCGPLLKEISQEPADLIHLLGLNHLALGFGLLRKAKGPVVASPRPGPKGIPPAVSFFGRMVWRKGLQYLGEKISEFIVDDPREKKSLASAGIREDKISAIQPGIDYPKMAALKRNEEDIVLCIGRYAAEKGQHVLVEAARQVLARYPETKFYLVGTVEDAEYYAFLQERIGGLQESIRLTGPLEEVRLLSLFSRAKLFVFPSVEDRRGLVNFEAMAAAIPVVASRVEGTAPFLEDGVNGVVVAPGDVGALAAGIVGLWGNRELREALAQKGSETARQWYWDSYSRRMMDTYERVTQGKSTSA
jgi:glycosyltransferase involved in cell wall biosynthesis